MSRATLPGALLLLAASGALAEAACSGADMQFHGTLTAPPTLTCNSRNSITSEAGSGVSSGAELELAAPRVQLGPDFSVAAGARLHATPQVSADLCGLEPLGSGGTTWYLCDCNSGADGECQVGDDTATGTTPNAPLRTYAKARQLFASLAAGDTIAFCRGGAFTTATTLNWVNSRCTAAAPCTLRSYTPPWASGDEAAPRLTAASDVTLFDLANGGVASHQEGYRIADLALSGAGSSSVGVFIYNDVDDVALCRLTIEGFAIGVQIGGYNSPPAGGSDGKSARVRLTYSRLLDNSGQGWLGGCDGCTLEANYFENNGYAGAVFYHQIYASSPAGLVTGMRIAGNELYRSVQVDGGCAGAPLVAHGLHNGLTIEANYLHEPAGTATDGCWGIAVDPAYSSAEGFTQLVVRGNRLEQLGNVAIGLASCQQCTVENNLIISDRLLGTTAIAIPDRSRAADDLPLQAVTVRNNSILLSSGATAIALGGEGSGHQLVSNAIHYSGGSGNWACFDLDLASSAYAVVDNNLCGSGSGEWERGSGDLASWQGASGLDGASQALAPQFASSLAPYDLRAASASSPMVDAGHSSASATTAYGGGSRDAQPDIGAYEY